MSYFAEVSHVVGWYGEDQSRTNAYIEEKKEVEENLQQASDYLYSLNRLNADLRHEMPISLRFSEVLTDELEETIDTEETLRHQYCELIRKIEVRV